MCKCVFSCKTRAEHFLRALLRNKCALLHAGIIAANNSILHISVISVSAVNHLHLCRKSFVCRFCATFYFRAGSLWLVFLFKQTQWMVKNSKVSKLKQLRDLQTDNKQISDLPVKPVSVTILSWELIKQRLQTTPPNHSEVQRREHHANSRGDFNPQKT